MEILVNEIVGIEPVFTQPGHPSALRININLSDCQAKDIFYSIWSYYGNEELKKWLELEGWEIRTLNNSTNLEGESYDKERSL